jgi:hypothetical protein
VAEQDRVSVWIHAYRGDRNETLADRCIGLVSPEPTFEECLLYAGHAGVSFADKPAIFGFLPDAPLLRPSEVLRQLKNLASFPGKVADHEGVFRYATSKGRTVLKLEYLYSSQRAAMIKEEIRKQQMSCDLQYAFPGVGGTYNCVTWLRQIGMAVPEDSVQMMLFTGAISALLPHAPVTIG